MELVKVSEATRFEESPFLDQNVLSIDKGNKTVVVGKTSTILLDTDTGATEAVAMLHKYREVDKEQFVKLFIGEIQSLFDISKTGMRVFAYVLQGLRINEHTIYINPEDVQKYCGYVGKKQVYKGLAELISAKIIAMSNKPNLWFVNPNIVFNGDRIAFIREYRLKNGNKLDSKDDN